MPSLCVPTKQSFVMLMEWDDDFKPETQQQERALMGLTLKHLMLYRINARWIYAHLCIIFGCDFGTP